MNIALDNKTNGINFHVDFTKKFIKEYTNWPDRLRISITDLHEDIHYTFKVAMQGIAVFKIRN